MTYQSEAALEQQLITQLSTQGYESVTISDESDLLLNLRQQLGRHNDITFSDREFEQVLNHLNKGNVFDRAKTLRDRMAITRDDETTVWIEFINQHRWCQNQYQVTNQITMTGRYENRYDVTLLINGLPLVQIELKRRGLELKEAFNQVVRYHKHSFSASYGLFQYVQIFVLSNGVNTKYFSNNPLRSLDFKQTFYWTDEENKLITQLEDFVDTFLDKCHVSKMITKYIVLNESYKILMVLRPYQYYAVERIIKQVSDTDKNGYIWHTTGSGKTLTSFKASQILIEQPEIHKVLFVVDRNDLDYQTTKEFNHFSDGSVDSTSNTNVLVKQLADDKVKLIVTTIQKLNNAITKPKYLSRIDKLRQANMVIIFDECHRSQFGDTHGRITKFFSAAQLFGFTGTPIFAETAMSTALGKKTTEDLFDKCLHKYTIEDAIRDDNVLGFSVEYVGRYQQKDSATEIDIEVEGIKTRELLESDDRLDKITDYIINHYDRKTHDKKFNAMFCVSGVDVLIRYYQKLQEKKEQGKHNLKIATIFSYVANEEDKGANDDTPDPDGLPDDDATVNPHTRDILEGFIGDYNQMFQTAYTTKDSKKFYEYYRNISKKVREREVDLLLVVNMFLTGFDAPILNTLFVDKNLRYHGLIQAFSRTNRLKGEEKSHGNIVVFRNLKGATDKAITLFSNKDAATTILRPPYEDYVEAVNQAISELLVIVPTVDSVNDLASEDDILDFVTKFREILRLINKVKSYADFEYGALDLSEQDIEDYKSKYLDIYDRRKREKEKVSILDDVDFELELIHRDEVNVTYIMQLLAQLKSKKGKDYDETIKRVLATIANSPQLRSKKDLIEQFILENLPDIKDVDHITDEYDSFMEAEKHKRLDTIIAEEDLDRTKFDGLLERYLFTNKIPLEHDVITAMKTQPSILHRATIAERIIDKITDFVNTFLN
jgi:type I restriction enzyme R subunit